MLKKIVLIVLFSALVLLAFLQYDFLEKKDLTEEQFKKWINTQMSF